MTTRLAAASTLLLLVPAVAVPTTARGDDELRAKADALFADYDSGLQWFRRALAERPAEEPVVDSVHAAIFAFPYDVDAVTQSAADAGSNKNDKVEHVPPTATRVRQ